MPARRTHSSLHRLWYEGSRWAYLLLPLALLFTLAAGLRRAAYRHGLRRVRELPVPVVVLGNITVGGTGKTPVTIWLADALRVRGRRPGIVSRGYRGVVGDTPAQANADSDPDVVGDEPILLATRSRCPVIVHPDRVAAARELVAMGVDVIIADDGLQHYRLGRVFEIAVIDGARGLGNGLPLPAGPLREPRSRLRTVDVVLEQQDGRNAAAPGRTGFHLVAHELRALEGDATAEFSEWRGRTVHAVAAVGNPERFFRLLEARGLAVIRHPLPDHEPLQPRDLAYDDELDIVMTEKDAVKCRAFASARHWYVPVDVNMHDDGWLDALLARLGKAGP